MSTSAEVLDLMATELEALTPSVSPSNTFRRWQAPPDQDAAADRSFTLLHRTTPRHTEFLATPWREFVAELTVYYAWSPGVEAWIGADAETVETALWRMCSDVEALTMTEVFEPIIEHDDGAVRVIYEVGLTYDTGIPAAPSTTEIRTEGDEILMTEAGESLLVEAA